MTVAAVVVAADRQAALADTAGRPALRRIVDSAWAGGALPIVVVAEDGDGQVATVLQGSPAVLVARAASGGAYAAGIAAAFDAVQETTAVLLWPGRMVWVDPETVTSLIESHGRHSETLTRPMLDGVPGWPLLVPADEARSGSMAMPLDAVSGEPTPTNDVALLELGDPGSVLGQELRIDELPEYVGPSEPVGGPPPEWGAAAADDPEPEVGGEA